MFRVQMSPDGSTGPRGLRNLAVTLDDRPVAVAVADYANGWTVTEVGSERVIGLASRMSDIRTVVMLDHAVEVVDAATGDTPDGLDLTTTTNRANDPVVIVRRGARVVAILTCVPRTQDWLIVNPITDRIMLNAGRLDSALRLVDRVTDPTVRVERVERVSVAAQRACDQVVVLGVFRGRERVGSLHHHRGWNGWMAYTVEGRSVVGCFTSSARDNLHALLASH